MKYRNELIEISKKYFLDIDNIEGLPIHFNLTNQIISKIKKEPYQIPLHFNGLLYFPVSPLYFMTTDINQIIERLENYITNLKSIIGIVIFSKIVDNNKEKKELNSTQINYDTKIEKVSNKIDNYYI